MNRMALTADRIASMLSVGKGTLDTRLVRVRPVCAERAALAAAAAAAHAEHGPALASTNLPPLQKKKIRSRRSCCGTSTCCHMATAWVSRT